MKLILYYTCVSRFEHRQPALGCSMQLSQLSEAIATLNGIINNLTNTENKMIQEASLTALGYIAEDLVVNVENL